MVLSQRTGRTRGARTSRATRESYWTPSDTWLHPSDLCPGVTMAPTWRADTWGGLDSAWHCSQSVFKYHFFFFKPRRSCFFK